jgi:hypothetical protein
MSNLNFSLDMGRVQSSVQAAIRPAVEEALASYDIKGAIISRLTEKKPKKARDPYTDHLAFMMFGGGASLDIGTLLDGLVREGIEQIAKEYVVSNLQMQRGEIEEAFRRMMTGSTNRLVKAFAGAVEGALKEDWGFELKVEVEHTVAERDRSDD